MGVVHVYASSHPCTLLGQIKTCYEWNNIMREKSIPKAKGRAVTPAYYPATREKSITKAKGRAVTPANCPATKAHVIPACNQTALSKVTISVMLICMKG